MWNCILQWRNNERDGNHRRRGRLLNRLFRRRSKKTSKLRTNRLCEGNPTVTGGFSLQRASNAEKFPPDDVIMTHMPRIWTHTKQEYPPHVPRFIYK